MKHFMCLIFFLLLASCQKSHVRENTISIRDINDRYCEIKSISCRLSSHGSTSDLFYEKPNKVFLKTYFMGSEELKVSSDGENYWFWMRSFDPKSVYFSPLDELNLTRVIDPLKPDLIKSLLFVDEIPPENAIIENEDATQVFFLSGQYYRSLIFKKGKIKEQHWLSLQDKPILSIYVLKSDIVPSLIKVVWHEQQKETKIEIYEVKINPKNKPNYEMPPIRKKSLKNY